MAPQHTYTERRGGGEGRGGGGRGGKKPTRERDWQPGRTISVPTTHRKLSHLVYLQLQLRNHGLTAAGPTMKSLYPNLKEVNAKGSTLTTKLDAGECDAAVTDYDSFRIQDRLKSKSYNQNCGKHKTGDVIYPSSTGWTVNSDSGVKCTGIICGTLGIYMVEVKRS